MNRFYGPVGYVEEKETKPGVFTQVITEHKHHGTKLSNYRNASNSNSINDTITINNKFSIVADPYAWSHFHNIRYITYKGVKWHVTSVEEARPRLILTAGGVYNGEQA